MEIFEIANRLGMITSEVYNHAQSLSIQSSFFCIGLVLFTLMLIATVIVRDVNGSLETKEKVLLFISMFGFIVCLVFLLRADNLFSELELEYKVLLIQKYGTGQII